MGRLYIYVILFLVLSYHAPAQTILPESNDTKINVKTKVPVLAEPFRLNQTVLNEGEFKDAMLVDEKFLFQLEPDRLLSNFRANAGLERKADKYGGWESMALAGHSLGHYLSALSLHYGATGSAEALKRINYIVAELSETQKARKSGYIGAIPGEDKLWEEVKGGKIETSNFNLNGVWAPWYTIHKILAGLLDAYIYAGNDLALEVNVKFSDWAYDLLSHLNDEQMQVMMKCEYGGMTEVLANTYALTGNKKYLELSYRFYDNPILDPLARGEDKLRGFHANTIIPKAIGSARRYELTGDENDLKIARNFWTTVIKDHTYALGGHSYYEYFHEPGKLNDKLADNTTETCNTYNMLKLTQHLFALNPTAELMDYYERALYNHILASQNPETGMKTYYVSLRMGGQKEFGDYRESFTCCMGTGMENHVKYNETIYFKGSDGSLLVNLFIPSELSWDGFKVIQTGEIPTENQVNLRIETAKKKKMAIKVRKPYWVQNFSVDVNGKKLSDLKIENGYAVIDRKWKNNDVITVHLNSDVHYIAMPDNEKRKALFYGPVMLAGDFGPVTLDPAKNIPVFVTDDSNPNDWIKRENNSSLHFVSAGSTYPDQVSLKPFYEFVDDHYTVYWDFFTKNEWRDQQKIYEEERLAKQDMEARTVSYFRPGEMQPERDHNLHGDKIYTGESNLRKWRAARPGGNLIFEMDVDAKAANVLTMEYWGQDNRTSTFDILVDDQLLATENIDKYKENRFYLIDYLIPVEFTQGKSRITIKLVGKPNNNMGPFYSARVTRSK